MTLAEAFHEWLNVASISIFAEARLANGGGRSFPGGSRERVTKAGDNVRKSMATAEDYAVINTWREAHRHVINSFQSTLRNRTRGTDIVVAQRHKRIRKLSRFPKMQLGRMDDVAGCRIIFRTIYELRSFRDKFYKARFNHKRKNGVGKYNYIERPKASGYRGIHDVYEYDVRSAVGKGLLIELQYRTVYQHAWATCVELVGFLTEDQPKFGRGDEDIKYILRLSSEIISRAFEEMPSSLAELTSEEVVESFYSLDSATHFMSMLHGLNAADRQISANKNIILIFRKADEDNEELEVRSFPDATVAIRALFELEKNEPGVDAVLVKGDRPEDVREHSRIISQTHASSSR